MRAINRVPPLGPVQAYRTFAIRAPRQTHRRAATCAEVDCPNYLHGWRVRIDTLTPEMLHTARNSGRSYTEHRIAEGETWLVYEAGQACFRASQHTLPIGKPELFIVRDGDWRGNPTRQQRLHNRAELWVEEFAENQDRIVQAQQRG